MSEIQRLLERNEAFAADFDRGDLAMLPRLNSFILTCVDCRVDPAYYLDLQMGESFVFRNAGARVTDEVVLQLGILWLAAKKKAAENFSGLEFAIVHHTDCGIENLAKPEVAAFLGDALGIDAHEIQSMGIANHTDHIKADIDRLRQSDLIPNELVVSGYIYDVHTGRVENVVAPAPLG